MATKTVTATAAPAETVDTRRERIAELRAALKAEQEALKAEAPKMTPLEREIARQAQATTRIDHLLSRMLERRVHAGQDREVAIDDIVTQCRHLLTAHQ